MYDPYEDELLNIQLTRCDFNELKDMYRALYADYRRVKSKLDKLEFDRGWEKDITRWGQ